MLNYTGKSSWAGRDVLTCQVPDSGGYPADVTLPARYFVCLLDWDVATASDAQIDALAGRLLSAGAVVLYVRGEDAGRVSTRFEALIEGRAGAWRIWRSRWRH